MEIPAQSSKNPSLSYARDVFLPSNNTTATKDAANCNSSMTNVDGLFAAHDIESDLVLFTENDMPGCELHQSSTNTNCELVELEDGTGAIVSTRFIKCGEFLCVEESDDDENESGGEGEEEEEGDWDNVNE